jgi:hypothetical protein
VASEGAFGRFSFDVLKNISLFLNRPLLSVFLLLFLSACASDSLLSSVTGALYKEQFGGGADAAASVPLNPAYRYLRVTVLGSAPALLVLGYVDAHPQGEVEVWYSAQQEVIKTQNGRIVGTYGLPHDWRNVRYIEAPPAWASAKSPNFAYTRVRDDMPGYHYGVTDRLQLESLTGLPPLVLPTTLPAELARQYTWLRESASQDNSPNLPDSWYALGRYQGSTAVVYSRQCLAPQYCLSLQRWPLEKVPS